jgi:hypothetical protein
MWFNIDKDGHDWRVDSSDASLSAFRALAADPYFSPSADDLGATPAVAAAPAVAGAQPSRGTRVVSTTGDWRGDGLSYDVSWSRCDRAGLACAAIRAADGAAYRVSRADVGHTLRSVVTATDLAGRSVSAASRRTKVVRSRDLRVLHLSVRRPRRHRAVRISFRVTSASAVVVRIKTPNGHVVRAKRRRIGVQHRHVVVRWYGRTNHGVRVRPGRYRVVVAARALELSQVRARRVRQFSLPR